jgi:hypothetical protein
MTKSNSLSKSVLVLLGLISLATASIRYDVNPVFDVPNIINFQLHAEVDAGAVSAQFGPKQALYPG